MEDRYAAALPLYSEAAELAHAAGDRRAYGYEFWVALCIEQSGRRREALSLYKDIVDVGRALPSEPEERDPFLFNAYTRCIEVSIELPLSLRVIRTTTARARAFLEDVGQVGWRHKLLMLEAGLALARGLPHEALAASAEAWSIFKGSSSFPGFAPDDYLRTVARAAIVAGEIDDAGRWVETWEQHSPNDHPAYRERELAAIRSLLALRLRDPGGALSFARHSYAQLPPDVGRLEQSLTLLRPALANGELELAGEALEAVIAGRHSQCLGDRLRVRCAQGDYWLARGRAAADLPPADEELEHVPVPCTEASAPALRRARTHLRRALQHAERIDGLLETTYHGDEIRTRLSRCPVD